VRIRLGRDALDRLRVALTRNGSRETGGQMFGEQLAVSDFRITELTVQARPGSFARFIVDVLQATRDAMSFFSRTQHAYRRYNYIGEWHSHPSFAIEPSNVDAATMRKLVRDPQFKGTFAILMIVRLDGDVVNAHAWLFDPQGAEHAVSLEIMN